LVHQSGAEIGGKPAEVFGEVHDVVEVGDDTAEEGKIDLNLRTGDAPVHEIGGSGFVFEDYSGDSFEKVGEIDLEEEAQTPSEPVPSIPTDETLTREGPRKKRVKTFTGSTDLSWVRKLLAQQSKSSSSFRQPSAQTKQPTQPTRKSYRLPTQGFTRRSSTNKQGAPVVEEIESSPEGSPIKRPETTTPTQALPVLGSEQASTETSPPSSKQTPASRPIPKRKVTSKHSPAAKQVKEPKFKRVKTLVLPSPNLEKFLKRSVVRGKIVKVGYFRDKGWSCLWRS